MASAIPNARATKLQPSAREDHREDAEQAERQRAEDSRSNQREGGERNARSPGARARRKVYAVASAGPAGSDTLTAFAA